MGSPRLILACLLLATVGCSGSVGRDEPRGPLVPGTCVNTDCTWPGRAPLVAGPLVQCTPQQGPPIAVVWSAEPLLTPCPVGTCLAAPFDVAVRSDGEVWTLSRLISADAPEVDSAFGFEVLRNGPGGDLQLEQTTQIESLPNETRGMSVTNEGELSWVGPSPSLSGVSLLHYDRSGTLTSSRWLIESVDESLTIFSDHGITVAYRYTDADSISRIGVARFAASGEIVWNQSAFLKAVPAIDVTFSMGVGKDGAVTLLVAEVPPIEEGSGSLLVHLEPKGRVAWARWLESHAFAGAMDPVDETFVLMAPSKMQAVDSNANGLWQVDIPFSVDGSVAITDRGRLFLPSGFPNDPAWVFSPDDASCSTHALDLQMFLPIGATESWTTDPRFAPLAEEHLAFAYSGRFGVLALPP